ncbi:nitrogen permease regulator of amino acid transport activity 3-domain-containing protein [Syncephalis plumigaleata]|nr:nitrogen permease regulator of amino acid transport activity 3-domain-containing protein [Syncephalis plumigaleata]
MASLLGIILVASTTRGHHVVFNYPPASRHSTAVNKRKRTAQTTRVDEQTTRRKPVFQPWPGSKKTTMTNTTTNNNATTISSHQGDNQTKLASSVGSNSQRDDSSCDDNDEHHEQHKISSKNGPPIHSSHGSGGEERGSYYWSHGEGEEEEEEGLVEEDDDDDDENEDGYNYTDTLEDTDVMEDDYYPSSSSNKNKNNNNNSSNNNGNGSGIPSDDLHKHGSFDHSDDTMTSNMSTSQSTTNELFGISKAVLANMLSPRTSLRDARFQLELDGDITMVGRPVSLPVMDIAPHPMVNRHASYTHSTNSTPAILSRLNDEIEEEMDKSNQHHKHRDTHRTGMSRVKVPVRKVVGRQALGLLGVAEKRSSELAVLPPTSTSSSKSYDDIDLSWRTGASSVPIKKRETERVVDDDDDDDDDASDRKSKGANGLRLTINTQVKKDDIAMPQVKLRRRSSAGTQPLDMIKLNHPNNTTTSSSNTSNNVDHHHHHHPLEGSMIPISQLSTDMMASVDTSTWSAPPIPFTEKANALSASPPSTSNTNMKMKSNKMDTSSGEQVASPTPIHLPGDVPKLHHKRSQSISSAPMLAVNTTVASKHVLDTLGVGDSSGNCDVNDSNTNQAASTQSSNHQKSMNNNNEDTTDTSNTASASSTRPPSSSPAVIPNQSSTGDTSSGSERRRVSSVSGTSGVSGIRLGLVGLRATSSIGSNTIPNTAIAASAALSGSGSTISATTAASRVAAAAAASALHSGLYAQAPSPLISFHLVFVTQRAPAQSMRKAIAAWSLSSPAVDGLRYPSDEGGAANNPLHDGHEWLSSSGDTNDLMYWSNWWQQSTEEEQYTAFLDQLYRQVVRKLTTALQYEQLRCDYVRRESELMLAISEEAHRTDKYRDEEQWLKRVLSRSSLARELAACYDAIAIGRTATLCVNGEIDLLVRGPLPCPRGTLLARRAMIAAMHARGANFRSHRPFTIPSESILAANTPSNPIHHGQQPQGLSISFASVSSTHFTPDKEHKVGSNYDRYYPFSGSGTFSGLEDRRRRMDARWHNLEHWLPSLKAVRHCLRAHHALLLCDDPEVVLAHIPWVGEERPTALIAFIELATPMRSLASIAETLGYGWPETIQLAAYLVYHRAARIIDPVNPRNIYIVAPNAHLNRINELSAAFAAELDPGFELTHLLGQLSRAPKPFSAHIPPKARRSVYLEAMVFLIRHRLVRQLHTYIYFTLPLSVARPQSTNNHLSVTTLMNMSLNPAVVAATAAPINNGMLTFGGATNPTSATATANASNNVNHNSGGGGNTFLRRGGGGSHADLVSSFFPSSNASVMDERSEAGDTTVGGVGNGNDTASRFDTSHTQQQQQQQTSINDPHDMEKCCALAMPQDYASDVLYEYIARLVAGHPRDIGNTLFSMINNGYLDGRHPVEEIITDLNMSRRDLNEIISRFRDNIVTVLR